jgi:hypothetical protein
MKVSASVDKRIIMRKILSIALVLSGAFFFLAIFPENAHAQFTTVTATVTDPNGIPYAAGTMSAILTPSAPGGFRLSGQPYSGRVGPATLDSTGKFTANFGDVTLITPSAQWQITVNSNPGGILPPLGTGGQTIVFTSTGTTISGGSVVNISTSLNALAPKLTNFAGTGSGSVTSVSGTAPIVATPSPIIGVGTISCPTCNTSAATIAGTIVSPQVAFGTGANAIGGSATFTWADGTNSKGLFQGPPTASFSTNIQNYIPVGIPELHTNRWVQSGDTDTNFVGNIMFMQSDKDLGGYGTLTVTDATNAVSGPLVGTESDLYFNVPVGQTNPNIQTGYETLVKAYGPGTSSGTAAYQGSSINGGTGTITTARGFEANLNNNTGGGTIVNSFGFDSDDMANKGTTLNAAFHASTQTAGANNWGFFSAATNKDTFGILSAVSLTAAPFKVTSYPSVPTSDLFIGTTGGAAGNASITGTQSVGIGQGALASMTQPSGSTNQQNTAVGYNACNAITSGRFTTCIGHNAGLLLTGNGTGVEDTVDTLIGESAGLNLTSSGAAVTHFVCVGEDSCVGTTTGGATTAVGDHSGGGFNSMSSSVMIGNSAGGNGSVTTSTSTNDVIIGAGAAVAATGAFAGNVIVGEAAAPVATAISNDVFIGLTSGQAITTAGDMVCVGRGSCGAETSTGSTVAVGSRAGAANLGGGAVFIGFQACQNATGSGNTFNICIGDQPALAAVGDTNEIVVGVTATGAGSNTATIGNSSLTDAYFGSSTPTAIVHGKGFNTATNCSSSASPAVCGSASAGSVAVPTGTNATLVVNTTAVTANSQIFVQSDDTLGTKLSVTCNSTLASLIVEPVVTARTGGTSFTITISGTTTTNPVCLSYFIVN